MKEAVEKVFNKLYTKYSFIEKDENKFKIIIFKDVEKELKPEHKNNLYNFLSKIANKNIQNYINELANKGLLYILFEKYITNNELNIKSIEKFYSLISESEYKISNEDYNKIINIECVNEFISNFINNNIENGFQSNDFINSLIDVYYDTNEEDFEIDTLSNNGSLDDSFKIYLKEIGSIPKITNSQMQQLFIEYNNGNINLKRNLISYNLRLVVSRAKKFQNKGLPLLDLIQEGNIGLMKAIDKYDYSLGYTFSTYATWWIEQTIRRALEEKVNNIKIPVYMYEKIYKYRSAYKRLADKLNRNPKTEEIAKELNISIEEVENLLCLQCDTISLYSKVDENNSMELWETLVDNNVNIEQEAINSVMFLELEEIFKKAGLNDRMIQVIKLRTGLEDGVIYTLDEIGNKYGVTRQRINELEHKALNRLRKCSAVKKLKM